MKKKLSQGIIACSLVSIVTLAAVCLYGIHLFTKRPLYPPKKLLMYQTNRHVLDQLGAQEITTVTADGIKLTGLLIFRPNAQRVILLCHGYRTCKERLLNLVHFFPEDSVILFDYRAHGQSEGSRTSIGFYERNDVLAAISWIRNDERTKQLPIFGIGVSMGAVSLLGAACQTDQFAAIVLDSPFGCLEQQASRTLYKRYHIPQQAFMWLGNALCLRLFNYQLREVDAIAWAQQVKTPTLIIHSQNDPTALFADAQELFNRIQVKKHLWVVSDHHHARIFDDRSEEYRMTVNNFFSSLG